MKTPSPSDLESENWESYRRIASSLGLLEEFYSYLAQGRLHEYLPELRYKNLQHKFRIAVVFAFIVGSACGIIACLFLS